MITEDINTEELIKETAKRIFFQNGRINATTQEIANEAGVNRALIHYYFRSRDLLFEKVFHEAMSNMSSKLMGIFATNDSLRIKISRFLDAFIDQNIDYPYLENFIITEITKSPEKVDSLFNKGRAQLRDSLSLELENEIKAGIIKPISIDHFMVNMMSMCNYPLIAKPILQTIFNFDDIAYRTFLLERKQVIYRVIFNEDPL